MRGVYVCVCARMVCHGGRMKKQMIKKRSRGKVGDYRDESEDERVREARAHSRCLMLI